MMRYRSRRDMIEIMIEPRFADIHKFKKETIKQTVSFPVKVNFGFFTSPKYFVPLLLLSLASLGQQLAFFLS